jgi:hypothetical protein
MTGGSAMYRSLFGVLLKNDRSLSPLGNPFVMVDKDRYLLTAGVFHCSSVYICFDKKYESLIMIIFKIRQGLKINYTNRNRFRDTFGTAFWWVLSLRRSSNVL